MRGFLFSLLCNYRLFAWFITLAWLWFEFWLLIVNFSVNFRKNLWIFCWIFVYFCKNYEFFCVKCVKCRENSGFCLNFGFYFVLPYSSHIFATQKPLRPSRHEFANANFRNDDPPPNPSAREGALWCCHKLRTNCVMDYFAFCKSSQRKTNAFLKEPIPTHFLS